MATGKRKIKTAGKKKIKAAAPRKSVEKSATEDLLITRIFDAPPEMVWRTWTEPERTKRWWGPKGFSAPYSRIDLRVGGTYLCCMRSPEGRDYWSTGVYREIIPLKRIVATDSFADENGSVVSAAHYGMSPDFPMELQITVTFEDLEGRTKFTLLHEGFPMGEDSKNARIGWNESLDKFAEALKQS